MGELPDGGVNLGEEGGFQAVPVEQVPTHLVVGRGDDFKFFGSHLLKGGEGAFLAETAE